MMPDHTQPRHERLQKSMAAAGIDVLICRLPENVVYLTEFWPQHGVAVVILPQSGRPVLFVPEIEAPYANHDWAEVKVFGWSHVKDPDVYVSFRELLIEAKRALNLSSICVGTEQSFEVVGPTYRSAEPIVPASPWHRLLEELFKDCKLVDAIEVIELARAVKGPYELSKIKVACEIAELGMHEFLVRLEPGLTEVQIGALIESKIRSDGPGYKGANLVRASAEVSAGPKGSARATLLIPSTRYLINKGDLVLVELGVVVDGYWADLTYVAVAGDKPDERQRLIYNAVLAAQQAAIDQLRAGNTFADPDAAAREVLKEAGLDAYFPHITGHGIGFRYHEFVPLLMPGVEKPLEVGMVTTVEPGVYIDGFGGIRIEDVVAIGADNPVSLSQRRKPW